MKIAKLSKLSQQHAKKLLIGFMVLVFGASLTIFLASAGSTAAPSVDTPDSPVDADKATITGTTEPGAKITASGGPYQIAPIYANNNGDFEVTVALAQENTNIFFIYAQDGNNDISDSVQVTIIESQEQAQAYEEATGEDRTAPAAPEIAETEIETDQLSYTIEGTGEANTTVTINNSSTGETVNSSGDFSVEIDLTGNDTQDKFSVTLMDAAGNLSAATKVYVTSSATNNSDENADGTDENTPTEDELTTNNGLFEDTAGHWAEDYIATLYELGAIQGYSATTFGPDDEVTRAQILKIALIAFGTDTNNYGSIDFNDVGSSAWYAQYVATGADEEIVQGYNDGTFRPDDPVTRAAAIKIILRAAGLTYYGGDHSNFTDISSSDWFSPYTGYAKDMGFIGGYDDGSFRPDQSITRAEVCKIIVEVLEYLEQ